jgi:hypothetical protein
MDTEKTDHASKILVENSKFHFTLIYLFLWLFGAVPSPPGVPLKETIRNLFFHVPDVDRDDGLLFGIAGICH